MSNFAEFGAFQHPEQTPLVMQNVCFLFVCYEGQGSLLGEHVAGLLRDPDEGGSAAQFLEFGCAHVGAGGAEPPQDVPDGVFYVSSVRNLHRPPFRRPEGQRKTSLKDCVSMGVI